MLAEYALDFVKFSNCKHPQTMTDPSWCLMVEIWTEESHFPLLDKIFEDNGLDQIN